MQVGRPHPLDAHDSETVPLTLRAPSPGGSVSRRPWRSLGASMAGSPEGDRAGAAADAPIRDTDLLRAGAQADTEIAADAPAAPDAGEARESASIADATDEAALVRDLEAVEQAVLESHRQVLEFLAVRSQLLKQTTVENAELLAENRALRGQLASCKRHLLPLPPRNATPPPPPKGTALEAGFPAPPQEEQEEATWLQPQRAAAGPSPRRQRQPVRPSDRSFLPGALDVEESPPPPPEVPHPLELQNTSDDDDDKTSLGSVHSGRRGSCESSRARSSFELLAVWKDHQFNLAARDYHRAVAQVFTEDMMQTLAASKEKGPQVAPPSYWWGKIVIHPYSGTRVVWDLLNLFVVLWDIVMVPFQFFDPPRSDFDDVVTWFTRLFWTSDMAMSFLTGFVMVDGLVELKMWQIWRRYFASWFLLDFLIVGVDWSEMLFGEISGFSLLKAGKLARSFRLLRMIRLLRLLRMREVLGFVLERVSSERLIMVIDIVKILFIMVGLSHFVACFWWALGSSADDTTRTWTNTWGYDNALLIDKYVISLNWALAQFAGGFQEVTAENPLERIYAMGAFLMAYLMSALFVSSLTSSMTQLNIIGSQQTQMASVLRRFLGQHHISKALTMRLQRNAQHAIVVQQRVMPESSVEMLSLVSEPLRIELHFEMYAPVLSNHPFFDMYIQENPHVMRRVCHLAASMANVSVGDVLFTAGELPSPAKMYVVVSGTLRYDFNGRTFTVREKHWLAEAVLWTKWVHCGVLTAATNCRICTINAEEFQRIAAQFEHHRFHPSEYAAQFVDALSRCDPVWDMRIGAEDWQCSSFRREKRTLYKSKLSDASGAVLQHQRTSRLVSELISQRFRTDSSYPMEEAW